MGNAQSHAEPEVAVDQQTGSAGNQKLTLETATTFQNHVKAHFVVKNQPEKFVRFLETVDAKRNNEITLENFIYDLCTVLAGSEDLIREMNGLLSSHSDYHFQYLDSNDATSRVRVTGGSGITVVGSGTKKDGTFYTFREFHNRG